jgi:DNA-binding NtrC family response regulator
MEIRDFRLLVIHPDAAVGEDLSQRLHIFAGHSEWCQEGVEGIRRCYLQWYDVVLVARWLRDMDAFELMEKVRLRDQKVPFIILVEAVTEAMTRQAREIGRCKLCSLTADFRTLEALLEEMLQKQSR